jgi:uncharacterized protein
MSILQLIEAVKAGNQAAFEELIKSGVDIDQQDEQGWTPLNWAAGKGDFAVVKLLVDHGADIFKVGRDQRTPYMIALAAGHIDVAKFLKEAEEKVVEGRRNRPERKYCRAYYLKSFRQFPGWTEMKIGSEGKANSGVAGSQVVDKGFSDDDILFLHEDLTVTRSMWHNEDVVFNQISPDWEEFCANVLGFKVLDDIDLAPMAGIK